MPRTRVIVAVGVATAMVLSLALASAATGSDRTEPRLPSAGLIGNQTSARSLYPVSRHEAEGAAYIPGSRVLRLDDGRVRFVQSGSTQDAYASRDDPAVRAAVHADRAWLAAGTVPGETARERAMATRALLDMRTLTRPNGAAVVAWHTYWKFVWPRDASWISVAFSATGHHAEALDILRFLARAQHRDGTWDARYRPLDATPVNDGREWQLDCNGWVPWAVWYWWRTVEHTPQTRGQLARLWPMVGGAADYAAAVLDRRGLPPASPDYWEVGTGKPNLGTAAPLLTGLRAAADLATVVGDEDSARRWSKASGRLDRAIERYFAPDYTRTIDDGSGDDASVTFLAPPFMPYDPRADAQVQQAAEALTIANGGIVPGEAWPGNPHESWTAETGWFALAAAGAGRVRDANHWLRWIAAHRTALGAIPEKVSRGGKPASVAPFAWTDAVVLLALTARDGQLPVPPLPRSR